MDEDVEYTPAPVDEARCTKLLLAAWAILHRSDATPLERQWAKEVADLAVALGEERAQPR